MKKHTDPTYLRTIYDGLNNGSLHKDNSTSLPIGLVGIYEDAIPLESSINERKKFLDFFTVWALLKKEVSLEFILPLLEDWTEVQLLDYIAKYSKWFNSPVSGKYQIYHERFRSFIFQKISDKQFALFNNLIINNCKKAIQIKGGDEWERYALEYMSLHLLISAMENGDDQLLKSFAYNSAHWKRQLQISKGFEWSKKMLNDMMILASKYNEEEVILCALNKVDLHHQEQNDATHIIELIAQNEIEIALQRIESFGGIDKEGIQRKFILYMLCLMELTLLESRNKPFSKAAIEKILKHLDNNLPIDHSILNWDNFFSNYLMLLMTFEWADLGLNYKVIYERADILEINWINEKDTLNNLQLGVLKDVIKGIENDWYKVKGLLAISNILIEHGLTNDAYNTIKETLICTGNIDDVFDKNIIFLNLASKLYKLGKIKESKDLFNDVLLFTRDTFEENQKISLILKIAIEIHKSEMLEEALDLILEALTCAKKISNNVDKCRAILNIVNELDSIWNTTEVKKLTLEVLTFAREISDEFDKNILYVKIANELNKLGSTKEAIELLNETFLFVCGISDSDFKIDLLLKISNEFDNLFMSKEAEKAIQEALDCASGLSDENDSIKTDSLLTIAQELNKLGKSKAAFEAINVAYDFALKFEEEFSHSVLYDIAVCYAQFGDIEKFLFICEQVFSNSDDIFFREYIILNIQEKLISLGKQDLISEILLKLLNKNSPKYSVKFKDSILLNIVLNFIDLDNFQMAFSLLNKITDNFKNSALIEILKSLNNKNKIFKVRVWDENYIDEDTGEFLIFQNEEFLIKENEDQRFFIKKTYEFENEEAFNFLSTVKNKDFELSFLIQEIEKINDIDNKVNSIVSYSNFLFNEGSFEFASSTITFALNLILKSSNGLKLKEESYEKLAESLIKQGQLNEIFKIVNLIGNYYLKNRLLEQISIKAAEIDLVELAFNTIKNIKHEPTKSNIWRELGKLHFDKKGVLFCKNQIKVLPNDIAVIYYLKGVAAAINPSNAYISNVLELIRLVKDDSKSIIHLLQMHAFNLCFFDNDNSMKFQRLNSSLNIQWAIDIKKQLK